ncbi:UDP-N-acetyl-D-mannosamine dehydrogenase [Corynebacterium glucuronolyticum]|uniref:UDP-N-acetyl-D-mannosamine dehydrogenase n=2 Tax=Corynebacterium glucuronolyticum TaxID=39791 RepID=A0A7T4JVY3_9CORY|nr:UDP-N-acetyl-D-mannosamine dehydrogenase [Corynebacterium glucuronolyticum]EEI62313.1 nucleotide sugar dehydrogenase [Corynebacterium glucuronolyticum ATCC 51866]QQB47414.1 UDP-N-acetyl-D-mannosamine dehydrogenase [Corynebacterium glucuronolyticum]QRP70040.1 UDP-N-acetyl-D-mannosamine dehydrogenase [Corynebacterium glucuronolyticum]WKD64250.1 UDP-N-acetyl-D-glucosamine 6-dehydrogenase [Corynebacterium glucuronolyticum DSM 44120]SMB83403.1 UDP-N-acetyl-D-mannosaminuronic acid dehydrogenase [
MDKSICFVGLGYIGLPTAVALANSGANVVGFDINEKLIEKIKSGNLNLKEPNLRKELKVALDSGNLKVSSKISSHDVYVIAVPTPFLEDHSCDYSYIDSAIRSISKELKGGELIILESTSAPGTTRRIANLVSHLRPDLDKEVNNRSDSTEVEFAYCPERILPGNAINELRSNDRVIGGLTERAAIRAKKFYKSFCHGELLLTDAETAEMVKLVENSYRDVNLAFANEISMLSDNFDVDVRELIQLANHHPRVNILQPSAGVGGHCIAVDPWFLVSSNPAESTLIATARKVNDRKPFWIIDKIESSGFIESPRLALLGITFKPNIDDLRESPALRICEELARENPNTLFEIVEPNLSELPSSLSKFPNVEQIDLGVVVDSKDPLVVLVAHDEFKALRELKEGKIPILDFTGILHG